VPRADLGRDFQAMRFRRVAFFVAAFARGARR